MIPINNSDIAWLIVTDYNQDNSLPYEDLRSDIISPDVNEWSCDIEAGETVGDKFNMVGTIQPYWGTGCVGNNFHDESMANSIGNVGGDYGISKCIGGNGHDSN